MCSINSFIAIKVVFCLAIFHACLGYYLYKLNLWASTLMCEKIVIFHAFIGLETSEKPRKVRKCWSLNIVATPFLLIALFIECILC